MECSVHTLVCDVIEVADDGKSARASFVTPGAINSTLDPDQEKWCHIMWERYGSDFVIDDWTRITDTTIPKNTNYTEWRSYT